MKEAVEDEKNKRSEKGAASSEGGDTGQAAGRRNPGPSEVLPHVFGCWRSLPSINSQP